MNKFDIDWYFKSANIYRAQSISSNIKDTVVAVIDSGLDCLLDRHNNLIPKHEVFFGSQIFYGTNYIERGKPPLDLEGHGTGIAGIIAGKKSINFIGGVNENASLLIIKAAGKDLFCQEERWADAIYEAVDYSRTNQKRVVINLSAGGNKNNTLEKSIRYALKYGVPIITISHNDNTNNIRFPGAYSLEYENVICIGSYSENGTRLFDNNSGKGSNYGKELTFVAPGSNIIIPSLGINKYIKCSGTSASAALVSGIISLILSSFPSFSINNLRKVLENSCKHPNSNNQLRCESYGFGYIDAYDCIVRACSLK